MSDPSPMERWEKGTELTDIWAQQGSGKKPEKSKTPEKKK
ncbi:unnamed protein product [Fusarium graminearum]|uniref:Chromosome 1, complete genome n=1 Tax=Gibberella zeae (strain ATCC MYA-4620 / CBS 123657 / FGSC 9075 / NRRL 31084 / PH-1) TaxID=229533 RepID=A0A1C3YHR4_GIBZE|nr:hypothetical protein FGRA07_00944 [Fusarium graminearum]SCB64123.1 unnamed protein product [Fusarium graminearum]